METREFIDKCVNHGYEWAEGECNGKQGYFVRSQRLDSKVHFTTEAIEKNDWGILNRGVIQGKDVYHMTRVVGYYSKVHNWNKSKLGELADRRKGTYAIN
ncbi:MAG: hypothetical protein HQ558_02780 [Candidatus Omnitrophica bacterium]|nr:hypothetical protein [Candidatus Omnitrophota bacterium]